jgi:hypothetical protein
LIEMVATLNRPTRKDFVKGSAFRRLFYACNLMPPSSQCRPWPP